MGLTLDFFRKKISKIFSSEDADILNELVLDILQTLIWRILYWLALLRHVLPRSIESFNTLTFIEVWLSLFIKSNLTPLEHVLSRSTEPLTLNSAVLNYKVKTENQFTVREKSLPVLLHIKNLESLLCQQYHLRRFFNVNNHEL